MVICSIMSTPRVLIIRGAKKKKNGSLMQLNINDLKTFLFYFTWIGHTIMFQAPPNPPKTTSIRSIRRT